METRATWGGGVAGRRAFALLAMAAAVGCTDAGGGGSGGAGSGGGAGGASSGCASDAECLESQHCSEGACVDDAVQGAACASDGECATGTCSDGVCCDSRCDGGCYVCSAALGAAADGTCALLGVAAEGSPSCAPYLCDGESGACPASCGVDLDCVDGSYCGEGACVPKKTVESCVDPHECASGQCVDGVCCDSPCAGECDVCAAALGASTDGTCTALPAGTPGDPSCAPFACNGVSGSCPSTCEGSASCTPETVCAAGISDLCVGTCGSADVLPATPASCAEGGAGAGDDCGPAGGVSCCDSRFVSCGLYKRSYDGIEYVDASKLATVSDFRLDTYEITVGRFRAFMGGLRGTQLNPPAPGVGAHPAIADSGWDTSWNITLTLGTPMLQAALNCSPDYAVWTDAPGPNERLPMNCITWYEAFAFCAWDGGRLPTEAEWNYAAAGGDEQRVFPWSSPPGSTALDSSYAVYDCTADGSLGGDCTFADIAQVGSRSPKGDGRWGQSDLAGSMWEWTLDVSGAYPVPCEDCANLTPGESRAIRGGAFITTAAPVHVAWTSGGTPTYRSFNFGARCARMP